MKQYIITRPYKDFFRLLSNTDTYRTYSIGEFYYDRKGVVDESKVNVPLRIDVDGCLHLCLPLAEAMRGYGLKATFFFLTHPDRYYKIWGSGVPKGVAQLGFEVGLHTDHYYEQLTKGIDGLARLKYDIEKLSEEAGVRIKGMVHHGHPGIDALGKKNWDLIRDIPSHAVGIDYHEGLLSCYIKPGSETWCPKCDIRISDFLGFARLGGWNYYPYYPFKEISAARPGDIAHIAFHVDNVFEYWRGWDRSFGETPKKRLNPLAFYYIAAVVQLKYGLLNKNTPRRAAVIAGLKILTILLAKGIGLLWPRPAAPEPDTSWETGRKRIYGLGIPYWRRCLEALGMTAPGGKVLEVGSGNGQWLIAYAEDSQEAIGIEPSRPIREYSIRKISGYPDKAKKIRVLEAAAERIPFADGYFDRVLCAGVFMFTNQKVAFREMVRVLKPGGKLYMSVNGLGYFIAYILDGLRYKSIDKMSYGINGLAATLMKWWFKKDFPGPKGVGINEMKKMCSKYNLTLREENVYPSEDSSGKRCLGLLANYAFLIQKQKSQ
jgi:SAM-dependent methyltransferase